MKGGDWRWTGRDEIPAGGPSRRRRARLAQRKEGKRWECGEWKALCRGRDRVRRVEGDEEGLETARADHEVAEESTDPPVACQSGSCLGMTSSRLVPELPDMPLGRVMALRDRIGIKLFNKAFFGNRDDDADQHVQAVRARIVKVSQRLLPRISLSSVRTANDRASRVRECPCRDDDACSRTRNARRDDSTRDLKSAAGISTSSSSTAIISF